MAGKSGREISIQSPRKLKDYILSWEAILILLFIAINIFCTFISPVYNIENVFREMPKYLAEIFLLFPMAYILLMGEIDISVGSIVCLSATIGCLVSNAGAPFIVVIIATLATGCACGMLNGFLTVTFRELPTMIITLGTQIVFRGIAEIILGDGGSVSLAKSAGKEGFKAISGKVGIIPIVFFIVAVCAIIFTVVALKRVYGRNLYAIGSNSKAAYYAGVKVKNMLFSAYTILGVFAGVSGLFLTSATFGANTTTGKNFEMDAIAMAVFGGISTMGGKGNLIGAIISAFIIVCLRIGLGQINMNPQVILIILGILLICAVMLPNISQSISDKKRKMKQREA
ncbi:MAG: ABC transporter permease [Eubacterium sp.]|nr:ABC transporter permease [Eubacterium sp.]